MDTYSYTHPFLNAPGTSRSARNERALQIGGIPIDGRTMADFLDFLYQYARQVSFQKHQEENDQGEYILLSNWSAFFEKSIPFLLARISKKDIEAVRTKFKNYKDNFTKQPTAENLASLYDFVFNEALKPMFDWYAALLKNEQLNLERTGIDSTMNGSEFGFKKKMSNLVSSQLSGTVLNFLKTGKKANRHFQIRIPAFFKLSSQGIWRLSITDITSPADSVVPLLVDLAEETTEVFNQLIRGMNRIQQFAPDFIQESLQPIHEVYQKYHEPHIGLMFTFLELFQYFRNDLNSLSQKHLDFFYTQVLQLKPRDFEPDHAHLVFQMAKHLDQYHIEKGTLFKNGKDDNKAEVRFNLPEGLVINKAAIKSLRTLFLNRGRIADDEVGIEGVYMSPVANSADGQGLPFPDGVIPNWATLGAKKSKIKAPGKLTAANHLDARLGFVLASRVLLLQEGKREINICLTTHCETVFEIRSENFLTNGEELSADEKSELESMKKGFLLKMEKYKKLKKVYKSYYTLTEETLKKLAGQISPDGFSYLQSLLAHQNPYIFGYDLDSCLAILKEPSCEEVFSKTDKTKIKECLATEEVGCYCLTKEEYICLAKEEKDCLKEIFPALCCYEKLNFPIFLDKAEHDCLEDEEKKCLKEIFPKIDTADFNFPICLSKVEYDKLKKKERECLKEIFLGLCSFDKFEFPFCLSKEAYDCLEEEIKECLKEVFPNIDALTFDFPICISKEDYCDLEDKVKKCWKKVFSQLYCLNENNFPLCLDEKVEIEKLDHLLDAWKATNLFKISLSQEETWYQPQRVLSLVESCKEKVNADAGEYDEVAKMYRITCQYEVKFRIKVLLDETEPAIICYDDETFIEKFKLKEKTPLLKVELNTALKIDCPIDEEEDACCLKTKADQLEELGLYHFLRCLKVENVDIDVKVCGIKDNILVQNDEGLLDHTSPFQPFGVRPRIIDKKDDCDDTVFAESKDPCDCAPIIPDCNLIGPNFYIGSNEIFRKDWKKVCVHLNWKDKPSDLVKYYEAYGTINEDDFELNISVLEQGNWNGEQPNSCTKPQNNITGHYNRKLFSKLGAPCECDCPVELEPYPCPFPFEQTIPIECDFFPVQKENLSNNCEMITAYKPSTHDGFIRLSMENQDFFHDMYSSVLSIQTIALANFPQITPGAIINGIGADDVIQTYNIDELLECLCTAKNSAYFFKSCILFILKNQVDTIQTSSSAVIAELNNLKSKMQAHDSELKNFNVTPLDYSLVDELILFLNFFGGNPVMTEVAGNIPPLNNSLKKHFENLKKLLDDNTTGLDAKINNLIGFLGLHDDSLADEENTVYGNFNALLDFLTDKCIDLVDIPLPNEPWTPTIQNLCIDYTACADKEDIELLHLYPYEGTYKNEALSTQPHLLPYFDEEGTLFMGFENLKPGNNLNLLFQLAESTADSELDKADVDWAYLVNNQWQPLRKGLEVIDDDTKGFTVSGIVKISIPTGINKSNTIMPSNLHWIKAFVKETNVPGKVNAICETLDIFTQAAKVTFSDSPNNDLNRLSNALKAESIAKAVVPAAGLKKIMQPYASFGGKAPEKQGGLFYQRVSEYLRHKGRGIARFDYESMILAQFPKVFKVKCINHDFGLQANSYVKDAELSPGFIVLAIIPDLQKLSPGQGIAPKAPVSLLEEIKTYLKKRISPFIRLKVLNPRYEKVKIKVSVTLKKGKNENYFAVKLKEAINDFLAPWNKTKDSNLLEFGKPISYSEVIRFVEQQDYVDFITCLTLTPESTSICENAPDSLQIIEPLTARSILTGGEICINISDPACEEYCQDNQKDCAVEYPFHQCTEEMEKPETDAHA